MSKINKIVIGIDQSYSRFGISICADGKLKSIKSIKFSDYKLKSNSDKRLWLNTYLDKTITFCKKKTNNINIIIERIRTFNTRHSGNPEGKDEKTLVLSSKYLMSTGALIGAIIDIAYVHELPVYSVDTRSWKSQVIGTSKVSKRDQKEEKPTKMNAIRFIESLGYDMKVYDKNGYVKKVSRGKKVGAIKYNDDAADSACISLYGFIPKNRQRLKLEQF